MLTNDQRLKIILTNLENYGWQVRYVDDGNGVEQPVKGLTTEVRTDSAAEMVLAVDSSDVVVIRKNRRSYITIIPSNDQDMLSDCGAMLADLELNPTDEQEGL